jgi:hypothetical protein
MVYLHVEYTYRDEVYGGVVAAWTTTASPEDPGHGHRILAGYADPIVAAQLMEEAVRSDAYVWVFPDEKVYPKSDAALVGYAPPSVKLDGLKLIWGPDLLGGTVRSVPDVPTKESP